MNNFLQSFKSQIYWRNFHIRLVLDPLSLPKESGPQTNVSLFSSLFSLWALFPQHAITQEMRSEFAYNFLVILLNFWKKKKCFDEFSTELCWTKTIRAVNSQVALLLIAFDFSTYNNTSQYIRIRICGGNLSFFRVPLSLLERRSSSNGTSSK